jgi:fluoroquinolone transport system permease protein
MQVNRSTDARLGSGGRAMSSAAVRALASADIRVLWRDPLLKWLLILPLLLAGLLRVLLPTARDALLDSTNVDLVPYYPLVVGGYLVNSSGIVGMVIGFLLLDERDSRTLSALRVTPLSMRHYLAYRIALPVLAGTVSTLVGYPLIGVIPLSTPALLAIAMAAAPTAPLLALILATAAPNKVAGLALVKVLNVVNLLPLAAFFVPRPAQFVAGVIPTYWPMRALWSAAAGEGYNWFLAIGLASSVVAVGLTSYLFERRARLRV